MLRIILSWFRSTIIDLFNSLSAIRTVENSFVMLHHLMQIFQAMYFFNGNFSRDFFTTNEYWKNVEYSKKKIWKNYWNKCISYHQIFNHIQIDRLISSHFKFASYLMNTNRIVLTLTFRSLLFSFFVAVAQYRAHIYTNANVNRETSNWIVSNCLH